MPETLYIENLVNEIAKNIKSEENNSEAPKIIWDYWDESALSKQIFSWWIDADFKKEWEKWDSLFLDKEILSKERTNEYIKQLDMTRRELNEMIKRKSFHDSISSAYERIK